MESNQNLIIVCSSTSSMLKAEGLLKIARIETDLVPTPSHYGSICSTSIAINREQQKKVREILDGDKISYQIYPYEAKKLTGLMNSLINKSFSQSFLDIMNKIEKGVDLTRDEIIKLLKTEAKGELEQLFSTADRMRREIVGDTVEIRAAIEFSNYCKKSCNYCGIRKGCEVPTRYRMTEDEILQQVHEIQQLGIQTVILQSGEDDYYTLEKLIQLITRIKQETGMRITLSIGERSYEEYAALKKAGANNFLLKIETTNPQVFHYIHPDDDLALRMQCTEWLKELGYVAASGNMVGLPRQTIEDIADDILYFKKMGIHMIGIGPFIPAKGTPFENEARGTVELTLKAVAVTRLVCKNVYIPATTALASIDPEGQVKALESGANTVMLISTPLQYRKNYQIYSNKNMIGIEAAVEAIQKANRKLPKYLKWAGEELK